MHWTLRIAAILAVLVLAYAIWPVAGFFRIASAIEARDAPALAKLVDFRALRKNLTKQVVAAYMELTGKEQKLGLLGKTFGVGVGTSYAEPIIAQLLNEHTLVDLLTKGKAGDQNIKVPAEVESRMTARVAGYFVEGHVPAADIKQLLQEKPKARGLAVPARSSR